MRHHRAFALVCHALFALAAGASPTNVSAQVPTPEAHFGFRLGSDRQLASMDAIEQYFKLVASQSDRVVLIDLGPTTEGKPTLAAVVSAPANIKNLDRIRANNRRLADPRTLPPNEARQLAASQKVILAIGASIHASEVGATQAASELLHSLVTATDPDTLAVLDNVVTVLIPSLNPDGHRLVTDWYTRTKGSRWEGGPMPWLYQKYAGHDINRDGFMLNLAENRNLARFFNGDWHPQVFLTMHQMEDNGPRFFVPPNTDPIDPNSDPLIWRSAALLGGAMAMQMQREGRSGVVSSAKYDYYWPGFEDSAPIGHNTVCLLTEVASVDVATPVTVPATELRAGFKGLQDYRPQINFPDPWPGGRWTLRDIVDYDLSAVRGLLYATSAYRGQLVQNFYDMGSRAVAKGREGGPFAFIITPEQRDAFTTAKLESLLIEGGVEIQRALEPFRADGEPYPEGTDIVFMAQPYRAFAKTLLEVQRYPARRVTPNGPPERPYDVAGWTLPLQMGVRVVTIERSFEPPSLTRVTAPTVPPGSVWGERRPGYWLMEGRGNGAAIALNRLVAAGVAPLWTTQPIDGLGFTYPPGSFVIPYSKTVEPLLPTITAAFGLRAEGMKGKVPTDGVRPVGRARVALYKPWIASIDEGWTRFLLEKFEFRFESIVDRDVRAGNLRERFDVIILPNAPADRLTTGAGDGSVPPEYAGGIGQPGIDALKTFVQSGGTLVSLGASGAIAINAFDLPLRDVARDQERLFVPGSIVKLTLDPSQPLAFGLPQETAAFFAFSSVYMPLGQPGGATNGASAPRTSVRHIGRYGDRDVLLSGWLEGEDLMAGLTAVAEAEVGSGRVVLFGFPVQHRGQSYATFRLLFNALFSAPQPALPKQR